MNELQSLGYSLHVVGGVIDGGGGMSVQMYIRRESCVPDLWLSLRLRTSEAHEA